MEDSKKALILFAIVGVCLVSLAVDTFAQERDRIVRTVSSRPVNQPIGNEPTARETQPIAQPRVSLSEEGKSPDNRETPSLVRKTALSSALTTSISANRSAYNPTVTSAMQKAIFARLGIPYRYGSSGPNRYDCSGFVWAVFGDAGIEFTRQSARSLWSISEPVFGDERFKFGTLVFLNGLGHIGIVADENGFYHASSSKGITYSPFKGYWEKRIVGFRRLNPALLPGNTPVSDMVRPDSLPEHK